MGATPNNPHDINNSASSPYPSEPSPYPSLSRNSPSGQTLPPIQHASAAMQSLYGNSDRGQGQSGAASASGSAVPPYGQTSQPQESRNMYAMPPYGSHPGYSGPMLPPTTLAGAHPSHQPIAPAPSPSNAGGGGGGGGVRGPPVLRPMPPHGSMGHQPSVPSPYPQGLMQPSPMGEGDAPTHVVGSQGRRGILPSAPGRPQAVPAGSAAAKNTTVPVKDADGKFPCPHCQKTYLHAKHLKRHLLRHTGDRPYMCVLCRDTFSRSDILKRHFQKCCIRRGNPQGVSHLSHPSAHVKKASDRPAPGQGQGQGEGDVNHLNGLAGMAPEGMHHFGMVPVGDGGMAGEQAAQLSRGSSLSRMDNGASQDRSLNPPSRAGSFGPGYGSGDPSQQMANSYMGPGQNGMSMYGGPGGPGGGGGGGGESSSNHQAGLDWSSMFPAGAQETYVSSAFTPNAGQTQIGAKDPSSGDAGRADGAGGHLSQHHVHDSSLLFANLAMPPPSAQQDHRQDPYMHLSNQILTFFYPPGSTMTPESAGLNLYFSPDNIRDFLDKYSHYHVHFPVLHTPSFRIMEAYTGLLAAICCIGACYSDRVSPPHVRQMMDFLYDSLRRDCKLLSDQRRGARASRVCTRAELEELQALMFMSSLFTWNGTPQQRATALDLFPLITSQARALGLFDVALDIYSPLHQPDFDPQRLDGSEPFDWATWIQQEERNRAAHLIFLCDAACGLYFNMDAQLDPFEMNVTLPCDDAAWDARTADECADALGLRGPDAARLANPDGTQRAKQPETRRVLQTLLYQDYSIQPGSTNLYGKFIMIHAVITLIRRAQLEGDGGSTKYGTPPPSDWMKVEAGLGGSGGGGGGSGSGNGSGRATPSDDGAQAISMTAQTARMFRYALDKFKANWDADMAYQFPPATVGNPRRSGFSRDGIHFFWLAKYLLKHTRPAHLQCSSDVRFRQVIHLLKWVKSWVQSDGASRGEELGSVGEINNDYGEKDATLDMADLFRPLPNAVQDTGLGPVVKAEAGEDGRNMM